MKKKAKKRCKEKMHVGGQAVMEGVMMRSPRYFAVAVRRKNKKIVVMSKRVRSAGDRHKWLKWPVIRGLLTMIESMKIGLEALDFSSRIYEEDFEKEEQKKNKGKKSKNKKKLTKKEKAKKDKIEFALTFVVSFALAILLFIALPWGVTKLIGKKIQATGESRVLFNTIIVSFKLVIFFLYVWLISLMDEIKRFFQYHGAEHKTIYAYENGNPLTYKYIKKYSTLHARCGTAFIVLLLLFSLFVFVIFLPPGLNLLQRLLIEIPLILPIAGISYELLKLSDRFKNNPVIKIFILPGLGFQKITTKEPDKSQVEVAAKALSTVLRLEKKRG